MRICIGNVGIYGFLRCVRKDIGNCIGVFKKLVRKLQLNFRLKQVSRFVFANEVSSGNGP
jgi:hypothetical protein